MARKIEPLAFTVTDRGGYWMVDPPGARVALRCDIEQIEIDAKRWRSLDAVFAVVGRIDGDPDTGSWTVCAFVDEGEAADYADLCARQIVTAPDEPDHRNGYTHPVRHVVADPVGHSYRIWGVIRYRVERLAIGSVAKDVAL